MQWTLKTLIWLTVWFAAIVQNQGTNNQQSMQNSINDKEIFETTKQKFIKQLEDNNNKNQKKPFLKPIRITFDTIQLDTGLSKAKRNLIHQLLDAVKILFEKMIKVVPIVGNNRICTKCNTCFQFNDLKYEKEIGIKNSDIHILVSHLSDNSGSIVISGICSFATKGSLNHPNFGYIGFNTQNFGDHQDDPKAFQQEVDTVIHEFFHLFGFYGQYMKRWQHRIDPGKVQDYNPKVIIHNEFKGYSTTILRSPNVLQIARKYFGCTTLTGIPLNQENNIKNQTIVGSHWDQQIIENELMVPFRIEKGTYFTLMSVGVLMDSGYWNLINQNFAYPIDWAQMNGCNLSEYGCQNSEKCSTEESKIKFEDDQDPSTLCVPTVSSRDVCIDLKHLNLASDNSLNDFGPMSKCFVSDLFMPNQQKPHLKNNRCHSYLCSKNQTKIIIAFSQLDDFFFTCGPNDFSLQKPVIYKGQSIGNITCPENYNKFCDYKICRNYCSSNGICVRGYCHCFPGYTGDDCSEKCSEQPGNQKCEKKCPNGTFKNPDSTCKKFCPFGYYENHDENQCQLCDFSCSKCSGPLENQCTACQYLTYLYKKQCFKTCPNRTYNDESTMTCVECPIGCLSCKNGQSCQTCMKNHDLDKGLCVNSICKSKNCNTCLIENNIQCTSCPRGTFLDSESKSCVSECPLGTWKNLSNNTCSACPTGCTKCDSAIKCLVCDKKKRYVLYGNTCTTCVLNCQTCDPTNLSYCTSCKNGQILHFNMCVNACPDSFYKGPKNSCLPCKNGCKSCNSDGFCNNQNKLQQRSNSSPNKK